jgi:hypothetical protein
MLRLWLLTFLIVSGCTFSTNPIFTEQDNVFDEALIGTWQAVDGIPDAGTLEVTRWAPDDNSYRVVLHNQADVNQGTFRLFLSQINKTRFLTSKFEKPSPEKASAEKLAVPALYLTYALDQLEGGQLKTRQLRGDWLAMQVKRKPEVLKHEWNPRPGDPQKQDLLLTAPTPELRAFVLSQLDKRDAWMPVTFKKIR